MYIFRPISQHDREAFELFAFKASIGLTSLPKNLERLHKKILISEISFSKQITAPNQEVYLFVMEDLSTGKVIGTSGIISQFGYPHKAYFYEIETLKKTSSIAEAPKEFQILRAVAHTKAASEICSLYLHPDFRHSGLGKLLSLSRFLFIASHPHRFHNTIVAELRGKVEAGNSSPFWDTLGKQFCQISYEELNTRLDIDRSFIQDILPEFPIYISLLPKAAQEAIGQINDLTIPAHKMLLKEGFNQSSYIDLFDAGPLMKNETTNIRTIKNSKLASIELTSHPITGDNALICNTKLDFRACISTIQQKSEQRIILTKETADALKLKKNDFIRYLPLTEDS